jgi:hypothetical protein
MAVLETGKGGMPGNLIQSRPVNNPGAVLLPKATFPAKKQRSSLIVHRP